MAPRVNLSTTRRRGQQRAPYLLRAVADSAELNAKFADEYVQFAEDPDTGTTFAILQHPLGGYAAVSLYGAMVTAWVTSTGKDALYVRPNQAVEHGKKFNGGILPCFPQVKQRRLLPPGRGVRPQGPPFHLFVLFITLWTRIRINLP